MCPRAPQSLSINFDTPKPMIANKCAAVDEIARFSVFWRVVSYGLENVGWDSGYWIFWDHRLKIIFPNCIAATIATRRPVTIFLSVINDWNSSLFERVVSVGYHPLDQIE